MKFKNATERNNLQNGRFMYNYLIITSANSLFLQKILLTQLGILIKEITTLHHL